MKIINNAGLMSGKTTGEIFFQVITSSINAHIYAETLPIFLIPSGDGMFADDDIMCQDDSASCHQRPANSPDLSPTENPWWKLKKMVHDKTPTCNADLETADRESWSRIDEEH